MALEITQIADAEWYAPDIGSNREQPDEDQAKVLIQPMTQQQLRAAEEREGKIKKGGVNHFKRYNAIRESVIAKCVLEVVNINVRVKQSGVWAVRPVESGEDLAKIGNEEILEDVYQAIRDGSVLEDGIVGKSVTPSATSDSPQSQRSDGVAAGAIQTSTQTTQETKPARTPSRDLPTQSSDAYETATGRLMNQSHGAGLQT